MAGLPLEAPSLAVHRSHNLRPLASRSGFYSLGVVCAQCGAFEKTLRNPCDANKENLPFDLEQRNQLLAAVASAPSDDIPRLIYADWLDERGECARAEFIRVQILLAKVRSSCECRTCSRLRGETSFTSSICAAESARLDRSSPLAAIRERYLWQTYTASWFPPHCAYYEPRGDFLVTLSDLSRGFMCRALYTLQEWCGTACMMGVAGEVCRRHPIERVHILDRAPMYLNNAGPFGWIRGSSIGGHPHFYETSHSLHDELWLLLDGYDSSSGNGVSYSTYPGACAALSRAAVEYGRRLARKPIGSTL